MNSGPQSGNGWTSQSYEAQLPYLEYDGNSGDRVSVPYQIRERHLEQDTKECHVQAIGISLQVSVWTDRDNILIRMPLNTWHTSKEVSRKFTGKNNGLICIGRFSEYLSTTETEDGEFVDAEVIPHPLER